MARERNPERDKARRIWLDSGGTLTARQVAEQVGVKPEQVRKWKSLDSWAAELEAQKPPRKRGGQPGNKNAAGAGAPHGNRNAETHGAYSTVRLADLPDEQREYIESITLDTGTNMAQFQTVKEGAKEVPYHADGELCRMYTAEEFTALTQAATAHVFYHRTYCNHLNAWIKRAGLDEIPAIVYGADLPADLAASMAALIEKAGGDA